MAAQQASTGHQRDKESEGGWGGGRSQVVKWDKEQKDGRSKVPRVGSDPEESLQAPRVYKCALACVCVCVFFCVPTRVVTRGCKCMNERKGRRQQKRQRKGREPESVWARDERFHTNKVQSDSLLTPALVELRCCVYTLRVKQMEQRNKTNHWRRPSVLYLFCVAIVAIATVGLFM